MKTQSNFSRYRAALRLLLLISMCSRAEALLAANDFFVYIGTYTNSTSTGIHAFRFEASTAKLTPMGVVAETPYPAFLAVTPDQHSLYAVNWRGSDTIEGNTVSAYELDRKTGKLTFLNKMSSHGKEPAYLGVDHSGKLVFVVNYNSGSVAAFPIVNGGRLAEASYTERYSGPSVHRQPWAHAHGVVFTPDNRFMFVTDLGLDRIYTYSVNTSGSSVVPHDPPFVNGKPGRGLRHLAIHRNGQFLYVNNETVSSVSVFAVTNGNLEEIQTLTSLPPDFNGKKNSTGEIQLDPESRFLYVSNRGHDSIAVFAVDSVRGTLTPVEHVSTQGEKPRNFSLDPTGSFLFAANQDSNTVVVFRVDKTTGRLTPTGQKLDIPIPTCVVFAKAE